MQTGVQVVRLERDPDGSDASSDAGAGGGAIDMHGAGAAETATASEL